MADLVDAVTVRPNVPGRNVVTMTVSDTRRPALAPIAGVSVTLRSPDGTQTVHPVTQAPDGSWVLATDDIRTPGRWRIAVTVLRPGTAAVTDEHTWGVAGGTAAVVVSAAPIRPMATALASILVAAVIAAAYASRRRQRRRVPFAADQPEAAAMTPPTSAGSRMPESVDA
jgi:copper transport protein